MKLNDIVRILPNKGVHYSLHNRLGKVISLNKDLDWIGLRVGKQFIAGFSLKDLIVIRSAVEYKKQNHPHTKLFQ